MTNIRASQVPEFSYKPGSLEAASAWSLFAIEGWACSSVRINLRKRNEHKQTGIRGNIEEQENKSHNIKELTPRGEQLTCRCPDWWASSHPAPRSQAPRGQALALAQQLLLGGHRDWRSCGHSLLSRRPRRDRGSVAPSPEA